MRKGEKWVFALIAAAVVGMMGWNALKQTELTATDTNIPFYSTASPELNLSGIELVRKYQCRSCHSLWTLRDMLQAVPAPALDGIGSLREEGWLYDYLAAENPQLILKTRLKREYQMPSYASMPEGERHVLAAYLASLKIKDWYLADARKGECEILTGESCP